MAVTIGFNTASLKAQSQLFKSSQKLSSIFERLSSGQRINKASDDAAGLAIASSLRVDQRVYAQGIRNLNDGLSALNIADGAVSQLASIVTRIKELATQSANGSLSREQRGSLDGEAQALSSEFLRITRTANFNGLNFFDGSLGSGLRLQGGYGVSGGILSSIGGALGTGQFSSAAAGSPQTGNISGMNTADINGDGILDLIASGRRGLDIFLGNDDGTFQDVTTIDIGDSSGALVSQLGDVNGDGVIDIVAGDDMSGAIFTLLGNGDGTFGEAVSFAVSGSIADLQLADLNNDGKLDVVTGNNSGGISVLIGNGEGTFQTAKSFASLGSGVAVASLAVADFDGDGILDLAIAGDDSSRAVSIQLGNGDGTFQSALSIGGQQTGDIAVGDFNGDGIVDIAASGNVGNNGVILLGNGDGTFAVDLTTLPGARVGRIETQDFNGDGILDLLQSDQNGISVLLGAGDGTFSISYSSANPGEAITTGDYNGDGVADFIGLSNSSRFDLYTGETEDGISAILGFSLKNQADALQALAPLSRKLESLSTQRGVIGAFQSRISSAVNALTAVNESYGAAESRIRDADIATESAELTRMQILQQTGAAILGQANQQPGLAIQLLNIL